MNSTVFSKWLTDLPLTEKCRSLNKVGYNLTICAREFQSPSSVSDNEASVIKKLLGLSELHHKLSAQIGRYCAGEKTEVYPEDVLGQILYEIAAQYEILPFLERAIQNAMTGAWWVAKNEAPDH